MATVKFSIFEHLEVSDTDKVNDNFTSIETTINLTNDNIAEHGAITYPLE